MKTLLFGLLLASQSVLAGTPMQPIKEIFEPSGRFDPTKFGKVAVVQWAPTAPTPLGVTPAQGEAFKANNRRTLEGFIRQAVAKKAEMVITSEFAIVGYPDIPGMDPEEMNFRNRDDIRPYVEPIPGPTTQYFSKLAAELKVFIHVGFAEVDVKTDKYYNTVVAFDPQGQIIAIYRKIHLFKLEQKFLSEGTTPVVYRSPFGKMGIIICSDVYSSFPMDQYKQMGVSTLALSTSWAQMNTGMSTFQSAASRYQVFILAANQQYFPDSGVVNPDGSTQSHIRQTNGIAFGYLPYQQF